MYLNIISGEVVSNAKEAAHEFYKTHPWKENWESEWTPYTGQTVR